MELDPPATASGQVPHATRQMQGDSAYAHCRLQLLVCRSEGSSRQSRIASQSAASSRAMERTIRSSRALGRSARAHSLTYRSKRLRLSDRFAAASSAVSSLTVSSMSSMLSKVSRPFLNPRTAHREPCES